MHSALPGRTNPLFHQTSIPRGYRFLRKPLYIIVTVIVVIWMLSRLITGDNRPSDAPSTVMVMVLNRTAASSEMISKIISNRNEYAHEHGYAVFMKDVSDYPIGPVPDGWASLPAIRHAMTEYPHSDYFWYLDQNAIIMNPALSLKDHITNPTRLSELMRRDVPVVPPDSVIKTYKHVPAERINFILTQDHEGLQPGSMIIRNSEWAKYLLDAWYDPIYRFYNFQKAEVHALEHIVQWHPTILTKLALIPQKIMNSYPAPPPSSKDHAYQDGEFLVRLHRCEKKGRSCEKEFNKYWLQRKVAAHAGEQGYVASAH
ncbi:hypothetical protein EX30DRAFT_342098 [Ascodesmis nigricans]|uniref:Uncharacterized protein n=1 Tax=Ascodesmis nigricans TaxID=341454 RepID=A0A4S2MTC5_9PEZI|nr:hypothetical protein EX30DRAFT_342098 [Ascodesmis nigricans]